MNNLTQKNKQRIHNITKIAILSAIAAILLIYNFPLPIFPVFYEIDFSETIVLMGGFAMGPLAAACIEALKIIIKIVLGGGSETGFVGEFANFLMGCSFTVTASLIYIHKKTLKGALLSLVVGLCSLLVVSALANYFIMIPLFVVKGNSIFKIAGIAAIMVCSFIAVALPIYNNNKTFKGALISLTVGMCAMLVVSLLSNYFVMDPLFAGEQGAISGIVGMASETNEGVKDLKTLILLATVPFNFVKGLVSSILAFLLYKRVSKILHI